MVADAVHSDAIRWVANKDLGDNVHAFPGQVQVGREAVLDAHDPLQFRQSSEQQRMDLS